MQNLQPDTPLFAGRYDVRSLIGTDDYGYIYNALDHSDDSIVEIHEFFPKDFCRRDPETLNMAILKTASAETSALYKKFSNYVSSLQEGLVAGAPRLIHAFKDHGTAYYVVPLSEVKPRREDPVAVKEPAAPRVEKPVRPAPRVEDRPVKRVRDADESRSVREEMGRKIAGYKYAILWYRIIIVLLVAIVGLLVYLNFFSDSPKVQSMTSHPVENAVALPADSVPQAM